MANKKSSIEKKTTKNESRKVRRSEKVARRLHISGLMMMIASVFMIAMPYLYVAVYRHLTAHTDIPHVDYLMSFSIAAGDVIALIYCLIGLFVFRAGENGTYLAKGMLVFNSFMVILSIIAAVLVFLPVPDQTFAYAMQYYNSGATIEPGIIPMAILTLIDMAIIIGLVGSVAIVDDMCVIKEKK